MQYELLMQRCLQLAASRLGHTAPNPMVGSVLVNNGEIIAEGKHMQYGSLHAEAEVITSVTNKNLFKNSTLFVNLEPCCHYGKNSPCTKRIIEAGIPKVVVGSLDPNPNVNGKGIKQLKDAGIEVIQGVLERECRELNKYFYTYHEKHRPFIFFKWAQTLDGFIDGKRTTPQIPPVKISGKAEHILVHKWRAESQSIMVGTNTVIMDNPALTARYWQGNNPLRIAVDRHSLLNKNYTIFDNTANTIVFVNENNNTNYGPQVQKINITNNNTITSIINELYTRKIQSLMIEGGSSIISSFIECGMWDEARVFISNNTLGEGVKAPDLKQKSIYTEQIANSTIMYFNNLI